MDHFDRIFAALAGEPVDHVPIALWRHYPGSDSKGDDLRQSSLRWQAKYDWDLLKITPGAGYSYEPWGVAFAYPGNDRARVDRGIREVLEESRPVRTTGDWQRIRGINVRQDPILEQQIAAAASIAREVGAQVPTLQTVMSPAYTVMNLAGRDRFLADIRSDTGRVLSAFEAVTETTVNLCHAYLDVGMTGLFFSTFLAAKQYVTPAEYRELCMPFDLQVLRSVRERTRLLVNHIHGSDIYFDLLTGYPVDAVNWEDRTTAPTLADGKAECGVCVIGGVSESVLLQGSPDEVRSEVHAAVRSTGGLHLIAGTGCVTPVITPEANILATRDAVNGMNVGT